MLATLFSVAVPTKAATAKLTANTAYYVVCTNNNMNVNVYCNSVKDIKNRTTVNLYKSSGDDTQKFTFKAKNGVYLMQPYKASGFTVNVSSLKANTSVFTWKQAAANDEYWIIESVSGGYTFRLKNAPSLYLTANGTNLTLAKYKGTKNQIFKITPVDVAAAVGSTVTAIPTVTKPTTSTPATPTTTPAKPAATTFKKKAVTLKVPSIKQTNKKWKNFEFVKKANPKCTIGNYGCMLTSVTAIMSYHKKTVYRPDQYYKKLSFVQKGSGAGNMKKISGWVWNAKYSLSTIKKQLDKGNPVMVGGQGKKGFHYVVVYGYTNYGQKASDYKIMDPSNLSKNLAVHISKFGKGIYYKK